MNLIGTNQPIHDAYGKVTGQPLYAADIRMPGMLHAAVLFSPIPHGIVKSIDVSKALALPGVVDVLHCFNTTGRKYNRYRYVKGQETVEQEQVFPNHIRFAGDRVACVLADDPATAKDALGLLRVEYGELPFTTDMYEAISGKIDGIHEEGAVYGDFHVEIGDKGRVEENAVETVTNSHLSRISHIAMEPHACVASYDKADGLLTVWSPNQSVHGVRTVIGDLFELPYHNVRVIKTTMGGSFGCKQEWMLEPVAAAAALKTGRPVRVVYSRGAAIVSTVSRAPVDTSIASKITREGKLQSLTIDVTLDAGAYLSNSYDYACAMASKLFRCYAYPYADYTARAVCTNTPVSGAFRGWSSPELSIAVEHNLNMAARKLGIDPLELRYLNAAVPGDVDPRIHEPLHEIRTRECIQKGRQQFDWDQRRREVQRFNAESTRYKRGVGVACGGHMNGYFPKAADFAAVDMRMTESGDVIANITLHDHGCGTLTVFRMMIAEALGIPMDSVRVSEGDTAVTPFDVGCFASRTTYVLGRAAVDCAQKLKEFLIEGIAEIHGVGAGTLEIADAEIRGKSDASIRYSYSEAAIAIFRTLQREVCVHHRHINQSNPGVTGTHFSYVEVDTHTGFVRILDYLAVHDIGRAINREMCVAQIQGAVAMGSGAALSEHLGVNPRTGRPMSGLKDYHVLNAPSLPQIRVEFVEDGSFAGPYGAKSIGEVCHVPVAPCVIGAVNDALNSELCSLPLNPDAIMALMQEKERHA